MFLSLEFINNEQTYLTIVINLLHKESSPPL